MVADAESRELPLGAHGRAAAQPRENDVILIACLAWAASLIHIQAAIDHVSEYWLYALFFIVLATAQVGWGIVFYRRPTRTMFLIGVGGSLAVAVLWLVSRTLGLPIGPDLGHPEPVGVLDAIATADELIIAALLWLKLQGPGSLWPIGYGRFLRVTGMLLLVLSSLVLAGGLHAH